MTRSVRVLQNTVNAGQTRFTGTVSELSPTAEAHVLAIYQNQLWLSAILGSGENATTVWVPLGRAGMVKTHIQTIPIFTWNVDNVFGSTDVTVQAYDTNGYVYFPSIQVTEETITVTHTAETAGRLVVISTDNLFSGAPDTGIRYSFVTSFATLPVTGEADVIYVARDTGIAYYYDVDAYHAFGTTVEIVNNLTTNDAGKALSAAQGFALKGLVDTKVTIVPGKQLSTEDYTAAEKIKLTSVETGAQVNTVTSVAGKTGDVPLVKADVGLGNVDNTADTAKPVSVAQQAALDLKVNISAIVNDLVAGGTAVPLSAEQGKVLKGLIDTINTVLQSDDGTLNELQEIVNYIKLNRAELDALNIASIAGLQAALDAKLNANDVSVTNAREWTATTVAQAEAETGTATTRRAWTAQRVFQAIAAWWAASAFKTKLDGIETGAQVNVATDLAFSASAVDGVITSSTGNMATIGSATPTLAGLMRSSDKARLDGIQAGAQVNVPTDLTLGTRTATTLPVLSSTGTDVTLPLATTSLAGVMAAADKSKLDGIAAGAQVNVATNLGVTAAASTVTVTSSTGTNAVLPAATSSLAGMFTGADKTSLEAHKSGIADGTLLNKYSLLLGTSTGAVNLATSQVWKITDPGSTRTISITNPPASTRSMSVVLQVIGNRATNWPAGVQWADGLAPVLAANWTMIILTYIDGVVYGSVGPSA